MASKERLTEDLLARLLAAPNVESYLGEPDSTLNRDLPTTCESFWTRRA